MEENLENTFTVTPMSQEFSLTPGETYEGSVSVVNPSGAKDDFHYVVEITPYSVTGTDYTADLATVSNYSRIVDWIAVENPTGIVHPNESVKVNFKITVPESAAGGGQYATIAIGPDEESSESGGVAVKNILQMASVIYGQVDGEISHSGSIKGNDIPGFTLTVPIQTKALLTNEGNVHESATIIIKATNFFTGEVILPKNENEGKYTEVVMPGTEREAIRDISDLPMLGVVKVEQTIYYMGGMSQKEVNVIICPIWFLILVLLTIAAFTVVIIKIIKKHKHKKARMAI